MNLPHATTSLCGRCKRSVPATLVEVDGRVVMRKTCPEHGDQEGLVSSDVAWWRATMAMDVSAVAPANARPVARGCPFDCGPCTAHQQQVHLPIVPITSSCDLDCPICYTHNKNGGAWHLDDAGIDAIVRHVVAASPGKPIINLTGGEPTRHPDLIRIVERCRAAGIRRVTISTHGLRFLRDEELAKRLAELEARVVLSFDSFDEATNKAMLGGTFARGKLAVLDVLERYGLDTTLLPVLARGHNDHELGKFVALALSRDVVRSLELHTMTFTGQGGVGFDRRARYDTIDVLRDVEAQTEGLLRVNDFVPSPTAHALCYQCAYLLRTDAGWVPFTRFMARSELRDLLRGGLYLEPGPAVEGLLADVLDRLFASDRPDRDTLLKALRGLVDDVFDPSVDTYERMRRAEGRTKAVYLHAHMDEETFDTDRLRLCPVGIREADGTNVPSCAYNVVYRERDPRFQVVPKKPIDTLGPGRIDE